MEVPSLDPLENHRRVDDSEYIYDDREAERRYAQWKATDPFPGVQPSLLHSGQILDYILKTGMLSPFGPEDSKGIKPASVEVPFEGQVVYWDEDQKKWDDEVIEGSGAHRSRFTLRRNSIAFVQVRPKFRLPYYIAVRFNLKITHVYRGLLLGTGPLVDPGYQGSLYIPLHNLTDNDYVFEAGEGLLWMEFTKLQWDNDGRSDSDESFVAYGGALPEGYKPFPKSKVNLPLHSFFEKANKNRPIPSSIPQEIKKARNASKAAATSARRSARQVTFISGIGVVGLLALGITLGQLLLETWGLVDEIKKEVRTEQADLRQEMGVRSEQIEQELQQLRVRLDQLDEHSVSREDGEDSVEN